jgi:hypothetical protein
MFVCAVAAAAAAAAVTIGPMPDKHPALLAYAVGAQAKDLNTDLVDSRPGPQFKERVAQFADSSMQLSHVLRETKAPADLACIFKGISEDAAAKADDLLAATTSGERAFVAAELRALFSDAAELAPQAGARTPATAPPAQYLTLQP